jgi:TRAP-type mannitol/chloroaromatic compound transport system permease small subunit
VPASNLQAVHSLFSGLSRWAVWVGGGALLLAAFMVTIDVISRKTLNATLGGADEISGYVFAAATAWAFPYCLLHRVNVRIDIVHGHLPSGLKALSDIVGLVLLSVFVAVLAYYAGLSFLETWGYGSVSTTSLQVPLWIPQGIWVAGLLFLLATCCFLLLYVFVLMAAGRFDAVARIAGIPSVQDTIDEETAGIDLKRDSANTEMRRGG